MTTMYEWLQAENKKLDAEITELKAALAASQKEVNDLMVRVEGLLIEIEGR